MIFANPWFLLGLAAVMGPIILHLINRRAARKYLWSAMRFLSETVAARRRSIEWENILLMTVRCLLLVVIALVFARPAISQASQAPWGMIFVLSLIAILAFAISFVILAKRSRWIIRGLGALAAILAVFFFWSQGDSVLPQWRTSGTRDIALIIDASSSMKLNEGGESLFSKALTEARELVKESPRGTAFSVILGGPSPERLTKAPLSQRADVLALLNDLEPRGGPFRAHEALRMATLSLTEGMGSTKEIVVFSDEQRLGWEFDQAAAWDELAQLWEGLEIQPRLILQRASRPANLRNVALADLSLSREIVGLDRPVIVRIRLENTGTEFITPEEIVLSTSGQKKQRKNVGQLSPGESVELEFSVHFQEAGPQVLQAELIGQDDFSDDNEATRVVNVHRKLPVLIVDGNSSADVLDRASTYLSLALAPRAQKQALLKPKVISAAALPGYRLDQQAVVVLADVPRLPVRAARKLGNFVANGGGLLVLAGARMDVNFYQEWLQDDGGLLPVEFGPTAFPESGVSPASRTFDHPALSLLKDEQGLGLEQATLRAYSIVSSLREGGTVAARFGNGAVFLATQNYGNGRVMVSSCGWDGRFGNLPARAGFVPLVHESIAWLAGGRELSFNLKASWSPTVYLPGGGGLRGRYYEKNELVLDRIDPVLLFEWGGDGVVGDRLVNDFQVKWTGHLIPPLTGKYEIEAQADDRLQLSINKKEILSVRYGQRGKASQFLKRGVLYPIEISYEELWGEARMKLMWTRPDGEQEVIPSSAMSPLSDEVKELVLGESQATDPLGESRRVRAFQRSRGRGLEVAGAAIPGLYELEVPEELQKELNLTQLPLAILPELDESRYEPVQEDDRILMRRATEFVEVSGSEELLAVMEGRVLSRDLTVYFTVAALLLFFGEVLLARWISKSRGMGQHHEIRFGDSQGVAQVWSERTEGMR